jgi:CHAT domain
MEKLKVLFIAANPEQTTRLKLDEEIRAITQKIRASDYRDSLELVSIWAVRPDDLIQSLNEYKPQIIHFSGHGSKTGEIILVDDNGQPKPVSPEAIKMLFKTMRDNIQLVVLNACYTKVLAESIVDTVGCTIGMNTSIGDNAAIIFSASFYRAIGFGHSVQNAFEQGKTALLLDGVPENQTPELLSQKYLNLEEMHLLILPPDDVSLLKQHRVMFDRPAYQTPCIDELFLSELLGAIDDTQAALNTGKLYSRSGKLLATFPNKNDYRSNEFRETFRFISRELTHLKRLTVNFQKTYFETNPEYSNHQNVFGNIFGWASSVQRTSDSETFKTFVKEMDNIDETRNRILKSINTLLSKYELQPLELIQLSSDMMKNGPHYISKRFKKNI